MTREELNKSIEQIGDYLKEVSTAFDAIEQRKQNWTKTRLNIINAVATANKGKNLTVTEESDSVIVGVNSSRTISGGFVEFLNTVDGRVNVVMYSPSFKEKHSGESVRVFNYEEIDDSLVITMIIRMLKTNLKWVEQFK